MGNIKKSVCELNACEEVVQTWPKVAQTSWQGQGKHPAEKVKKLYVGIGKSWEQLPDKAWIRILFHPTVNIRPWDTYDSPSLRVVGDLQGSLICSGILENRTHRRNM